jgi:alpha-galactosidase
MAELKFGSFGYQYLSVDDCWAIGCDKSTHAILPNPKAFPQGMKAVVDGVHAHGLKFGICEFASSLSYKSSFFFELCAVDQPFANTYK